MTKIQLKNLDLSKDWSKYCQIITIQEYLHIIVTYSIDITAFNYSFSDYTKSNDKNTPYYTKCALLGP